MLERGKHCIEAARQAYDLLKKEADHDTTMGVLSHLEVLIEDGQYLQRRATDILNKLLLQEKELDISFQKLLEEKKNYEMEIEALGKEKTNMDGTYSSKELVLNDNEKQVQRAQKELQDAENELQRAKKKAKKKKKGILGKIKSAFKKLVGLGEKKVDKAKKNLERRRSELKSAQSVANNAKQALFAIQKKIDQYIEKIKNTQQLANQKHSEIGSVKSSIALLQKSSYFWELFVIAAQSAEKRTSNLKKIMDLASEEKDYELLSEDGTITRAKSFIEAWEIVATDRRIE